ncbi:hypothetical protein Tco_0603667 [Tanacetum coccineum]
MFSLNKSSAMHEKPHTPRSCLRWKPTGRIFKTVGLRWIPTGKMFTDSTTNVDSEPLNGSNDDIANPYECDQTLYFSAGTFNSSAGTSVNPIKERLRQFKPRSSLSDDVSSHQFRPRSSSNDAPFLKEKKGVRFSALYLQKKRNLLVFDHSHQQVSYFSMLVQSLSGSTYISCDSNVEYLRANLNIKDMSNSRRTSLLNIDYMLLALAGPNPEHMHDVFLATNYPKVHEILKHTTKEHVHLENPPSSSRTLSSMKNLEDNFTFGDQVINDKSQKVKLGKTTMESEVESMVIVPIQQASLSAPPLNTPVIDLSSPSQNQYLFPVKNHSLQLPSPTPALQHSRTDPEMVKSWLLCKLV